MLDIEFFIHLVWVLRFGSSGYLQLGQKRKRTTVFSIVGELDEPILSEVPSGMSLEEAFSSRNLEQKLMHEGSLLIPGNFLGKPVKFDERKSYILSHKRTAFYYLKDSTSLSAYLENTVLGDLKIESKTTFYGADH